MIFPQNNLPTGSQQWGKEIQKIVENLTSTVKSNDINNMARDKQLAASISRLDKAVVDLANTKSIVEGSASDLTDIIADIATLTTNVTDLNTQIDNNYVANTMSLAYAGADGARTDSAVATLTFTKPAWATKATVVCTGTIDAVTTDQAANPISGTMTLQIDSTKLQYSTSISDPTPGGTVINRSISTTASNVYTSTTQSFTRTFSTTGSVTVDLLVTKTANTLTTASFYSNLSASVYWSK